MPSFGQLKDMYKIQREAKRVKKELANIHVEAEGRMCNIVVNGEQEIIEITFKEGADMSALPSDLKDALNRAMKKAQVVAAERMQSVMAQMGLPTEADSSPEA